MLRAVGRVVPAANQPAQLTAVMGGKKVSGQALITKGGEVSRPWRSVRRSDRQSGCIDSDCRGDQVVLGPGASSLR